MICTDQTEGLAREDKADTRAGLAQASHGQCGRWARCVGWGLALLGGTAAQAQEFPTHPVRIVSITGAGTGVDDFSRLLAKTMGEKLGQSVIIENKPGANGIVAHDTAAKSPADGYTLLYTSAGSVFVNPHAFKKLPYAPGDLVPVRLQAVPIVLTVSGNSPYRTVAELKAAGQANPGKLNWSYSTSGYQVMTVALNAQLKIKAEGVAYKSTTAAVPDLIAGSLDYAMLEVSSATPMVQSQKLRVLAVAAPQRLPQLPDVPTFAEVGLGDAALLSWMELFAPAKTPQAHIDKLSAAAMAFMQSPEAAAHFKQRGTYALGANAQAFAASMGEDQARWKRYIDLAGLKAE